MSKTLHNWFECKIQYEKLSLEDGLQKKVTATCLVDALSFTEAEARIIEELSEQIVGEFTVCSVRRSRIYELFKGSNEGTWFKVKILFVVFDQEKGVEKRKPATIIVESSDLRSALDRLDVCMSGTMSDYLVASIAETPIVDVFHYVEPQNEQL
jgi:hypothetical protein